MAFSFNWAGLQVPTVQYTKAVDDPNFGANLGAAARGFENRQAAKEFARKIEDYRKGRSAEASTRQGRIAEIQDEIARLEAQNAELQQRIDASASSKNVLGTDVPQQDMSTIGDLATRYGNQSSNPISDLVSNIDRRVKAKYFEPTLASKDEILDWQQYLNQQGGYGLTEDGVWGPKSQQAFNGYFKLGK